MPGAEQSEDFAAERASEQPVDFIQAPDQGSVELGECFASDVALKINVRPAPLVPNVLREHGQIQLLGQRLAQGQIKVGHGFKVRDVELLEIGQDNLGAAFARL